MNEKKKRSSTWGDIVKERVRRFFKELLLLGSHENQNKDIHIQWEDENNLKPKLIVKSKRRYLQPIANLTNDSFYETIRQLKELGILEDWRQNKKGSEDWYFALKLGSKDTETNLREFDQAWENRRPKGKGESKLKPIPAPQRFEPIFTEFEIEREPQESQCLETILQLGSFLRIKGPQNMGKTRLLNRVLAKVKPAQQDNCQIVIINWRNEFDSTAFNTYEQFLENFCATISQYLGLPDKLDNYWNRRGSPNHKTTGYFSDYLLPQIESQLILVLQEMDLVFNYDKLALDFCGLLRGWHENSKRDRLWLKLNLVIVHSTDRYASLKIEGSPLANIGETVTIQEFTRPEVDKLIEKYGLSLGDDLEELITLVNQHPFLINRALKKIAEEPTILNQVLSEATTQGGIYHQHLLKLWNILKKNLPLKKAFKQVVNEFTPVPLSPEMGFQLERLGLIKISGNLASPRCPLYRQYFAKYL